MHVSRETCANVRCTVCKHKTSISIKKWRLKEVIDLCDSD